MKTSPELIIFHKESALQIICGSIVNGLALLTAHTSIDLFLDVCNWYLAKNPAIPEYTFERTADNTAFKTSDGLAIQPDGRNAIPTRVKNDDPFFTPSIGLIVEF